MSVEYRHGGRRRIDRVLDPEFSTALPELDDATLRSRRDDAQQEEVDLSYLRRLLHGRLDLLEDERKHRTGDRPAPVKGAARSDAELAEALSKILADDHPTTRGSGRFLSTGPSRVGEHRREVELAVDDLDIARPSDLPDASLGEAIARLRELEGRVSHVRREVQDVEQLLTDELGRRLQRAVS